MRKLFGVLGAAVVAAVGAMVIRTTAASAQGGGTWVAYGYNDATHKYTCLTSTCPGGWCCWIEKPKK